MRIIYHVEDTRRYMRNTSCEWLPTPMPSGFDRVRMGDVVKRVDGWWIGWTRPEGSNHVKPMVKRWDYFATLVNQWNVFCINVFVVSKKKLEVWKLSWRNCSSIISKGPTFRFQCSFRGAVVGYCWVAWTSSPCSLSSYICNPFWYFLWFLVQEKRVHDEAS